VLFVGLMVVGVALSSSSPDSNAPGARVIRFYIAHRKHQQLADVLFVFAALFVVFFAGSLHGYLRRSTTSEAANVLIIAGAVLLAVGLTVLAGVSAALADVPGRLDPSSAQALNIISNDVFWTLPVGGCVFGLASATAILRGGALPNWLGWIAVVIGIAMATPVFWISAVVLFAWTLIVGGLIYVRSPQPQAAPNSA
jgi:hypothetical protein